MRVATVVALLCALALSSGCRQEDPKIDRTPLPTVAAAPYICGYIPLRAVELITGVRDPLVRGNFDLTTAGGLGDGRCAAYQRDGERLRVLHIVLIPSGTQERVEKQIKDGARPMSEIVPGSVGYYFKDRGSRRNAAYAMLVRGEAELIIELETGVEGRDNAADVVALMKLIAPKLITDASAPGATMSPSP
ncbi:hypothetical protein Mth01_56160 [Sphaerimonospora thailandensis]|uniref:DUF3558 domain-containing protein n=2 Tax=Sphaerimonospora thailandensis TaxID=795644 RepID=A0A8J3RJA6_9ACTN|nr:hypothetical protein Mth01_56160 [Sphaerimonospora thailandensis]